MNLKKIKKLLHNHIPMDKISLQSKVCLTLSAFIMGTFFFVDSLIVFGYMQSSYSTALFGYACIVILGPVFTIFVSDFLKIIKSNEKELLTKVIEQNTYLEHAAKILRHDMHSGLNTYIPRGIKSLERRLPKDAIEKYKIESPLRLLKEGLSHAQQVYKGVFEFTNLVREGVELQREVIDIPEALEEYLKRTSYKDQVLISEDLPSLRVNESLFCTAIDNLIRNGLKYNDNLTKWVKIEMLNSHTIAVIDNGRGMTSKEFNEMRKVYSRKSDQKESGTGLGLNICIAIFNEHGYTVSAEKLETGTLIKIGITND